MTFLLRDGFADDEPKSTLRAARSSTRIPRLAARSTENLATAISESRVLHMTWSRLQQVLRDSLHDHIAICF
jgi:hypothetical protein